MLLTGHLLTSGVYDENTIQPNTVDRTAPGSTVDVQQFSAAVADAYAVNRGGVLTGDSVGSRVFWGSYGEANSKTMYIDLVGTNIGVGSLPDDSSNATAISGTDAYSSTAEGTGYNFMEFDFRTAHDGAPIPGSETGEEVVAFGLTFLSLTGRDYGNVTVVAKLSDGSTQVATQAISEDAAQGDTFFGFRAPNGLYFDSFTLSYDAEVVPDVRMRFDDIGFITENPQQPNLPLLDILPGDDSNSLNGNRKTFEIALLGSDTLDVAEIDIDTIRFGAVGDEDSVQVHKKKGDWIRFEDVNADGVLDLVARIEFAKTGLTEESVDAVLTAQTLGGTEIYATDSIAIRRPGKKR